MLPRDSSSSASSSSSRQPSTPAPSGLAILQQFQRKKETWAGSVRGLQVQRQTSCVSDEEEESGDVPERVRSPDTPPSQDSAYFSQPNSTYDSLEETPTSSFTRLLDASTPSEVMSPLTSLLTT